MADCTAADILLDRLSSAEILHGDKGCDTNAVRRKIEDKGAAPNIPPKANRTWKNCFSPYLYRNRNAIERMFARLKDFRRIATRYDRLAKSFPAAVCLAATLCYWLRVWTLAGWWQSGSATLAQQDGRGGPIRDGADIHGGTKVIIRRSTVHGFVLHGHVISGLIRVFSVG